jgi:cysteinyl-tRNA synthetase
MAIYLYNTLTSQKEAFIPLKAPEVSFYTCGVTSYDYCHVGHARVYVVFDCIRRHLTHRGYTVRYVQNFTDIDDKIIKRAADLGEDWQSLTTRFIEACLEDLRALNVMPAESYPKATDYILHMQNLIGILIDKKAAYVSGGDVYFSVSAFPDYGKLSKKVLEDLVAGSRVDVSDIKRDPLDFVLWKSAKPGEPFWASPWGNGRPGWHIECSAMVLASFGGTIDIHAGGQDLIFPHHENEICQSECATDIPFARYWLHNGFVTIRDEKMAKSAGNFFTIRDLLVKYSGEVIRFFLLKTHYRSPLGFSLEGLDEASQALSRLQHTLRIVVDWAPPTPEQLVQCHVFQAAFEAAMDDDFNTVEAIGILFDLNKYIHTQHFNGASTLALLGQQLGLFSVEQISDTVSQIARDMMDARMSAKKNRNYAEADRLRDLLLSDFGIVIEDVKDGYRWYIKRNSL